MSYTKQINYHTYFGINPSLSSASFIIRVFSESIKKKMKFAYILVNYINVVFGVLRLFAFPSHLS